MPSAPAAVGAFDWLLWSILATACLPAVLFAVNVWFFRRPGKGWNREQLPPVSVLIPARNEESAIAAALESVLASRGVVIEIVVLDDDSQDRTAEIVAAVASRDPRVRVVSAPPLPAGWNGKQHACWTLSKLAAYPVLCYLDADVRVGPEAIYRMVSELRAEAPAGKDRLAIVSGFPQQQTGSLLEWLLLPLIHFVLLGFLPFPAEHWSSRSGFAAGCGQFMMVRKESYGATGGHSAIRASMHDGLLLPQLFRREGYRTRTYDLSRDAVCRMYKNSSEVWRGLSKNATEGMASLGRLPFFTLILGLGEVLPSLLLLAMFLFPASVGRLGVTHPAGFDAASQPSQPSSGLLIVSLAALLGFAVRLAMAALYRQSWKSVLVHPVGVLVLLALQWNALAGRLMGRQVKWKDRSCPVP